MEITLNIKPNTYQVPNEVREFAVQALCDYLLDDYGARNVFHPKTDSCYRRQNIYVKKSKKTNKWVGCGDWAWAERESVESTSLRTCEVQAAFKALIANGYHIFRVYSYGCWLGYVVSPKPHYDDGTKVSEFTEFID